MLELIQKHPLFMIALIAHLLVSLAMCVLSWIHFSNEKGVTSDEKDRQGRSLGNAIAWSVSVVVIIICLFLIYSTNLLV